MWPICICGQLISVWYSYLRFITFSDFTKHAPSHTHKTMNTLTYWIYVIFYAWSSYIIYIILILVSKGKKTLFPFWFDTKYDEISKQREITNANVKLCVNTPSNEEILKMFYQIFWVGIFFRCLFSASFHNYNGLYEIWRATSSKSVIDKTDGRRSKIEALNLQPCEKYR